MSTHDRPGDRSLEILTRLDLLESKIDWIARRVALQQHTRGSTDEERAEAPGARSAHQASGAHKPPRAHAATDTRDEPERTAPPRGIADPATVSTYGFVPEKAKAIAPSAPSGPPAPQAPPPAPKATELPIGPQPLPAAAPAAWGTGIADGAAPPRYPHQPDTAHQPSFQPSYAMPPAGGQPLPRTYPGAHAPLIRKEGNLGRYLLSGAAALLVVLAAVSLIALVWDSIPDDVKVGSLGLLGLVLVATGTWLTVTRPSQRVAAATITGTGGALGFVAIIGAVLLGGILPLMGAFLLMAAWGIALLVLSRLTAQFFTAVVSAVGAIVTIGFASWQTWTAPTPQLNTWSLTTGYALTLVGVTTVLARVSRPMPRASWYPATSLVVLGAVLVLVPVDVLVDASPLGTTLLLCLTWAALLAQQLDSSRLLWRHGYRQMGGSDWALVGLGLTLSVLYLLFHLYEAGPPKALALLTGGIVMTLLAATSTAMLDPGPEGWRRICAPVHLATTIVLGMIVSMIRPELFTPFILISALACAPVIRERFMAPVALMPFLGCTGILLIYSPTPVVLGVMGGLLAALIITLVLERRTCWGSAPGREDAAPPPTPVRVAVWGVALALVIVLPALFKAAMPRYQQWSWALAAMLAGLMLLALLCTGLLHPQATPRRLLSLALVGQFPTPPSTPLMSPQAAAMARSAATRSWWGWLLGGIGAHLMLGSAWTKDAFVWRALLVLLALALAVVATRMRWAWIKDPPTTLAAAGLLSVVLWQSVSLLSGQSMVSVLGTVVVLLTGALCIILGFRLRLTMLRHYGLALVLVSVLKLAILDLGTQNSFVRVLALAAAGVVCFLLSLAYNRIAAEEQSANQPQRPAQPLPSLQQQPSAAPALDSSNDPYLRR